MDPCTHAECDGARTCSFDNGRLAGKDVYALHKKPPCTHPECRGRYACCFDRMRPAAPNMTADQAANVYTLLIVACGANPNDKADFIAYHLTPRPRSNPTEWRFGGNMGSGGKFTTGGGRGWRVTAYNEDATPERTERMAAVNTLLAYFETPAP
jgi:hypothetical protein